MSVLQLFSVVHFCVRSGRAQKVNQPGDIADILESESSKRLRFQFITLLCFYYKMINKSSKAGNVNIFAVVYTREEERNLTCN